jgi:hypothetical protein
MKKIKFIITAVCLLTGVLVYVSCQSSDVEPIECTDDYDEMRGVQEYRQALIQLNQSSMSRSEDEEPTKEDIEQLVEISREFLLQNDITTEDLSIEENDEIIAVVAMALLDYQKSVTSISRTTIGGCVIEALGVKEVVKSVGKGAAKYVAKAIAKAALKKTIPYVGWGLFVWDYVDCITE